MAMKIDLIGKEVIKPASSTPHRNRTLQLSFVDNVIPPIYVVGIFFYYNAEDHNVSLRLKKSLSETLTSFYPLAGRIQGASIDCNDQGAVFIEARADCLLSDFLRTMEVESSLRQCVPSDSGEATPETMPLLRVKVTHFRSGGLAIGVCASHKILDASSFSSFVRGWADAARGRGHAVTAPEFAGPTIYPPPDPSFRYPGPLNKFFEVDKTCLVSKRFVFEASKIAELKSRVASESVENPTRVEAVVAIIWRCVTKASRTTSPSAVMLAVDMRRRRCRAKYPTQDTIGNLVATVVAKEGPESEMEIRDLVANLSKKKKEMSEKMEENLGGDRTSPEFQEKMKRLVVDSSSELTEEMKCYTVTSRCGMAFYEVDFGWGKPVWVAPGSHLLFQKPDCVYVVDAKDGLGVEAWVILPQQDMLVFEHDPELLAFATPNPTLLI